MKKVLVGVLTIGLILGLVGKAGATILDFEGLTGSAAEDITTNNQGYGGFTWDTLGWFLYSDTVYPNPAHSGDYGIVNNYGVSPLGVSSGSPFDFTGAWVSGWYFNSPQQIKAQGFDASDTLIAQTDWFPLTVSENHFLAANFQGVSRVNFVGGQYYTVDDFTYNANAPIDQGHNVVPEPATILLLSGGLAGMYLKRKRRS